MRFKRHLDRDRAGAYLRSLARDAVPVRGVGLLMVAGRPLPVAHLDARRRPDIRDLGRVHRAEAPEGGDVWAAWTFVPELELAVLAVKWRKPVRCAFRLVFHLRRQRSFLEAVAAAGHISFAVRDPAPDPMAALATSIAAEVPTADLRAMLAGELAARRW